MNSCQVLYQMGIDAGFWTGFATGMFTMFCLSILFWLTFLVPDKLPPKWFRNGKHDGHIGGGR